MIDGDKYRFGRLEVIVKDTIKNNRRRSKDNLSNTITQKRTQTMTNTSSTSSNSSSFVRSIIYNSNSKIMGSSSSSSYHHMMVVRYMSILLLTFYSSTRSFAFLPTVTQQQQQQQNQRGRRRIDFSSSSSSLAVSSSTTSSSFLDDKKNKNKDKNDNRDRGVPTVEFIDPQTGCEVVLLGCFHGTESSAKDVQHVITPETDFVVLELCQKRFDDLQCWMKEEEEEEKEKEKTSSTTTTTSSSTTSDDDNSNNHKKKKKQPWMIAYLLMIQKTIHERGLSTGLAAAVLGGFSGMQTALSGFSPGLEFKTALECAQQNDAEIVLADRDVDETLKQIGNIPQISFDMLFSQNNNGDNNAKTKEEEEENEYQLHATTLQRAVFGPPSSSSSFHPVQLGHVLVRSTAAVQDLIRLTIPPTFLYYCFIQIILSTSPTLTIPTTTDDFVAVDVAAAAATTTSTITTSGSSSSVEEMILHLLASFCILSFGYFGIALPSVRVILTERDQCLAEGIQQACSRAGKNGRVVAVLGLLHLNGVATRMLNNSGGIGVGDFDDDYHANVCQPEQPEREQPTRVE